MQKNKQILKEKNIILELEKDLKNWKIKNWNIEK